MSSIIFRKHRVFKETDDVTFYDISVEECNATDLVVHKGAATSPPDDLVGVKQFYIHRYQEDYDRVIDGMRTFEIVNSNFKCPYHIIYLRRQSGALYLPKGTYHRSTSGENGSIVINQAHRYEGFNAETEFIPVSAAEDKELYDILKNENPVIHTIGE